MLVQRDFWGHCSGRSGDGFYALLRVLSHVSAARARGQIVRHSILQRCLIVTLRLSGTDADYAARFKLLGEFASGKPVSLDGESLVLALGNWGVIMVVSEPGLPSAAFTEKW